MMQSLEGYRNQLHLINLGELKVNAVNRPVEHLTNIVSQLKNNITWKKNDDIVLTNEFCDILTGMEYTHRNIFINGVAGTGKSTLLDIFKMNTRK